MKSIVRVLAAIAGLILLLVLGLVVYLKFVFDPNDFRERIGSLVEQSTGRKLSIEGDLRLSVFPWLGLEIGSAELANASGFSDLPLARIRSAQLRARLMPLLRGEVDIDRVTLDGLALVLERRADGLTNWADLAAADAAESAAGGAIAPPPPPPADPAPLRVLALGGFELTDAALVWDDRRAGSRHEIRGLSLTTGRIEAGKRFALELGAQLASSSPQLQGQLRLVGQASADLAAQRYQLAGMRLELGADGGGVPGGKASIALGAELSADLAAGTAKLDALQLAAYGLRLTGDLVILDLAKRPQLEGDIELDEFSPRELAKALGVALPPSADPAVLSRARLKGFLRASAEQAEFTGFAMQLDATRLVGNLGVPNFIQPALSFDLAVDAIDLDRYLAPKDAPAPPAAAPAASDAPAQPAIPEKLRVRGEIQIGKLKLAGLEATDIRLPLSVEGGRAMLRPVAKLYEGSYRGNIGVDGRGKALGLSVDEVLSGVQIGPLLRDFSGKPEQLTGKAELSARLMSSGLDGAGLMRNLNGSVALRLADGALKGVNLAAIMRQAEALLTSKPAPPQDGPNQTDFSDLAATLTLTDGVARNDDLLLRSPLLRVSGAGSADLAAERIDYLVRASLVGTLTGQGGKSLDKVRGVTVPVRVRGSFDKPEYALDSEALLSGKVKQVLEEKKQEVREKAKDRLQDELQKGLGKFFK